MIREERSTTFMTNGGAVEATRATKVSMIQSTTHARIHAQMGTLKIVHPTKMRTAHPHIMRSAGVHLRATHVAEV